MSDACVRCGQEGEDRRTLWMACLYEMAELGLPFQRLMVRGTSHELERMERKSILGDGPLHDFPVYAEEPKGPARDHHFYTLRVCKDCRASWMGAIERWFNTVEAPTESPATGIWVRERGALREITMEEWEERRRKAK